ncbi:MAG: hypothetical protein GY841_19210 [FCB group bacterium]|nr:hypothetical protein [FCB group bacterium]
MHKKIVLYFDPRDESCGEIKEFLEKQGIDLRLHDISTNPLNARHLSGLLRNLDIKHFLSPASQNGKKKQVEEAMGNRGDMIALMADDNSIVQWPILVAGRLMSVGSNRQAIIDMLQLSSNGSDPDDDPEPPIKRRRLKK